MERFILSCLKFSQTVLTRPATTGGQNEHKSNIEDALEDIRMSLLEAEYVQYSGCKNLYRALFRKTRSRLLCCGYPRQARRPQTQSWPRRSFYQHLPSGTDQPDGAPRSRGFGSRRIPPSCCWACRAAVKQPLRANSRAHLAKNERKPLLVAADIYRPAAVRAAQSHRREARPACFLSPRICSRPKYAAVRCSMPAKSAVISPYSTLPAAWPLMNRSWGLHDIASATKPENIFLVCDAMIGQDAVNTAETFNKRLDVTGFIMTKLDGDARGRRGPYRSNRSPANPLSSSRMGEGRLETSRVKA